MLLKEPSRFLNVLERMENSEPITVEELHLAVFNSMRLLSFYAKATYWLSWTVYFLLGLIVVYTISLIIPLIK